VLVDPDRLRQIASNLLSNAVKFTPHGGRIDVTCGAEGPDLVLSVSDTGIGFNEEVARHLFERFRQGDSSTTRRYSGLGLGLGIVRHLTELHGGSVTATSQGPGTGTTITVRLPLFEDAVSAKPAAIVHVPPAAKTLESPCRVLVVDDNADAALTMALMLRMSGHEVETAEDGLQALEIASVFSPQIVLLDLGMPKLNGYETAKRIREAPWGHNVSLIALTGWGQPKDRQRTLEAGFNAHLVKPVGSTELMEVISRVATPNARASALN